jgi:hypothetical protein
LAGVEIVHSYEYLGVPIDSSLTKDEYFATFKKKINKMCDMVYKFFIKECSLDIRKQIF